MNKEELVLENFRDLFNKLSWLNKCKMEKVLSEYKPSEVHCMAYIENHEDTNVTKLAEAFYMTRGAISKLTKKLMDKGYIESYQKSENKKEIYFKLTEKGKEVNVLHESLHREFKERDKAVFAEIREEQYDAMLNFMARYSDHLDLEIAKLDLKKE